MPENMQSETETKVRQKIKTKTALAVMIGALVIAATAVYALGLFGTDKLLKTSEINTPAIPSAKPDPALAAAAEINVYFTEILKLTKELGLINKVVSPSEEAGAAESKAEKLIQTVESRALSVKALMKKDPRLFLSIAMPEAQRASFPANIQEEIERQAVIVAEIETRQVDDFENPRNSHFEYFLNAGNEKINFYPAKDLIIVSGARVQVKGFRLGNEFAANINQKDFQILNAAPPLDSIGEQKTLVLLIEFLDSGSRPFTKENAYDLIFNGQFQNFMKEQSYNQVSFSGDVSDWITIQRSIGNLGDNACGHATIADQEIQDFINNQKIDLGNYDRLVYAVNHPLLGGGCSGVGKGTMTVNGKNYSLSQTWIGSLLWSDNPAGDSHPFPWTTLDFLFAHELGHALGVIHANGWDCGGQILYGSCQHLEYGNLFDAMGNGFYALHFNSLFKEMLGWVPASRSLPISQSGTYTINPLESDSGINFAKVKILNSETIPFYLEYRKGIGFDANLNDSHLASNQAGLFVNNHIRDRYNVAYSFPRLLDMDSTSLDWWEDLKWATLNAPSIFNDPGRGITIGPIKNTDASSVTFDVKIETPICVRQAPITVQVNSGPREIESGGSGYVGISFLNSDYFGCSQSDFGIIPILPASWSYNVSEDVLLSPGDESWAHVSFLVPQDASPGEYPLKYEIINKTSGLKTILEKPVMILGFNRYVDLKAPIKAEKDSTFFVSWLSDPSEKKCRLYFECGEQSFENLEPNSGSALFASCNPGDYKLTVRCFNESELEPYKKDTTFIPLTLGVGSGQNILVSRPVGDINEDGAVSCQDYTELLDMYLGKKKTNAASDVNGDGLKAQISDIQMLINILAERKISCSASLVNILSPNGREKWKVGKTYKISWKQSHDAGVAIVLRNKLLPGSKDGLQYFINVINTLSGKKGRNSYNWTISPAITPSGSYEMAVVAGYFPYGPSDQKRIGVFEDYSDAVFTIEPTK